MKNNDSPKEAKEVELTIPNCAPVDWQKLPSTKLFSVMSTHNNALLTMLLELGDNIKLGMLLEMVFLTTFIGRFKDKFTNSPKELLSEFHNEHVISCVETLTCRLHTDLLDMFYKTLVRTAELCGGKIPKEHYFVLAIFCENGICHKYSFGLHSAEIHCEQMYIPQYITIYGDQVSSQISRVWFGFAGTMPQHNVQSTGDAHLTRPMFELRYDQGGAARSNQCDKLYFNIHTPK